MVEQSHAVLVPATARLGFELVREPLNLSPPESCLDVFTTLYEPEPVLRPGVQGDPWALALKALMESALYQQAHETTVLDHEISGVAVKPMMEHLEPLRQKIEEHQQLEQQLADDPDDTRLQQQVAASTARLHRDATAHIAEAVSAAKEAIDSVYALRELGCGNDAGRFVTLHLTDRDFHSVAELIRRFSKLYGRFLHDFKAASAHRIHRTRMLRGVTLGNKLTRVLPSQLSWLCDDDLESIFTIKWLESRLLLRDTESSTEAMRGDVVVCVDESGSMSGDRVIMAKAYAFALRKHMESENRRCHILSFSYQPEDMRQIPPDATPQQLVEWLSSFIGGGTHFEPPLEEAMRLCNDKADIVMVTDGEAELSDEFQNRFTDWKRSGGARLFLLHLERQHTVLRDVADHVLPLDDILALLNQLE